MGTTKERDKKMEAFKTWLLQPENYERAVTLLKTMLLVILFTEIAFVFSGGGMTGNQDLSKTCVGQQFLGPIN